MSERDKIEVQVVVGTSLEHFQENLRLALIGVPAVSAPGVRISHSTVERASGLLYTAVIHWPKPDFT